MDNQLIHNYIKDLLINLASASPMTIYQTCILGSLISLDPKYVIFSLLALIFGDGFNFIEKDLIISLFCFCNNSLCRSIIYSRYSQTFSYFIKSI